MAKAFRPNEWCPMRKRCRRLPGLAFAVVVWSGCVGVQPQRDVRSRTIGSAVTSLSSAGPLRTSVRRNAPLPGKRGPRVRLVVSIPDRRLSLVQGRDTLFQAPVAVASGLTLVYGERAWRFQTPRGERQVIRKVMNPVWTPPDFGSWQLPASEARGAVRPGPAEARPNRLRRTFAKRPRVAPGACR